MTTPAPDHRRLFGGDPGGYDRARPDYPPRVYEILTARCGLRSGAATLEIGPGSGLATRRLLACGADPLVAVEPDARLATYLSRQLRAAGHAIDLRVEEMRAAHAQAERVLDKARRHYQQRLVDGALDEQAAALAGVIEDQAWRRAEAIQHQAAQAAAAWRQSLHAQLDAVDRVLAQQRAAPEQVGESGSIELRQPRYLSTEQPLQVPDGSGSVLGQRTRPLPSVS